MSRDRRLVLVRHGRTARLDGVPSAEWRLTPDGLEHSRELARRLGPLAATVIHSSAEPKAVATAHAMAGVLGLPVVVVDGIHEHDRRDTPLLDTAAFEAALRRFFDAPSECVFGRESAGAAAARFASAIDALTSTTESDDVIVVTHGTVMTLFLSRTGGVDAFSFWRRLAMPCAAIVRLEDRSLERLVVVPTAR